MKSFNELNDFLSEEEIERLIDEVIDSHKHSTDKQLIDALEQLCELADRQCNTYTILSRAYQEKITSFIERKIKFNDLNAMDAILYIIPNFGLQSAFEFILKNKDKIQNKEISDMLDQCIREYGDTVENPYSDM